MTRLLVLGVVVGGLVACGHDLDTSSSSTSSASTATNQPRDLVPAGGAADDVPGGNDDAPAGNDDAPADNDAPAGNDGAADDDGDAGNDGAGNDGAGNDVPADAPGPPPAEAGQSCSEWTDCGPHYVNPNSGFDCVQNACVCNSDGNWDDACAQIGGVWSDEDCFCYVGADPMPTDDADEWTAADEADADADADRTCWWRWRETCEPDRWVDTGGYEYVCDSGGDCGYEYEEDGYWESGDCSGYWLRRCDDGTEKRY